ncbi:MAG: CDP-diacylglycerol--glycerol-3-phosphate 3-phosphatidyltransferase [Longimicrobiales bacterium]|nr:CDP-diacylglycerol--glycerol-3-phosphate 3-phosphatidyltransferase [Longimicrobiales bacterium]
MSPTRLNLPNVITVARIAVCPAIFLLALSPSAAARFAAFGLFVLAGLSDVWDGWLARRYDLVTDMGKLLDPIADKLLLVVTLVPFYLISQRPGTLNDVPWWGPLPLWVLVVIFGRELFITLFRAYAARRGVVIAAGPSGKRKALFQMLFTGGLLLWYPLSDIAVGRAWSGWFWSFFANGLRAWVAITLAVAIFLTIYSMLDYLWSNRSLFGVRD